MMIDERGQRSVIFQLTQHGVHRPQLNIIRVQLCTPNSWEVITVLVQDHLMIYELVSSWWRQLSILHDTRKLLETLHQFYVLQWNADRAILWIPPLCRKIHMKAMCTHMYLSFFSKSSFELTRISIGEIIVMSSSQLAYMVSYKRVVVINVFSLFSIKSSYFP